MWYRHWNMNMQWFIFMVLLNISIEWFVNRIPVIWNFYSRILLSFFEPQLNYSWRSSENFRISSRWCWILLLLMVTCSIGFELFLLLSIRSISVLSYFPSYLTSFHTVTIFANCRRENWRVYLKLHLGGILQMTKMMRFLCNKYLPLFKTGKNWSSVSFAVRPCNCTLWWSELISFKLLDDLGGVSDLASGCLLVIVPPP